MAQPFLHFGAGSLTRKKGFGVKRPKKNMKRYKKPAAANIMIQNTALGGEKMFRFSGFTPRANDAVNLAIAQACILGHTYIGSEHLLLGLLLEGSGTASVALRQRGVAAEAVLELLVKTIGKGIQSKLSPEDLTPRCRRILESALAWAKRCKQGEAGTEHILLSMLREKESYALRFLRELGVDCAQLLRTMEELEIGRAHV